MKMVIHRIGVWAEWSITILVIGLVYQISHLRKGRWWSQLLENNNNQTCVQKGTCISPSLPGGGPFHGRAERRLLILPARVTSPLLVSSVHHWIIFHQHRLSRTSPETKLSPAETPASPRWVHRREHRPSVKGPFHTDNPSTLEPNKI